VSNLDPLRNVADHLERARAPGRIDVHECSPGPTTARTVREFGAAPSAIGDRNAESAKNGLAGGPWCTFGGDVGLCRVLRCR
jgi:hypothetical protein